MWRWPSSCSGRALCRAWVSGPSSAAPLEVCLPTEVLLAQLTAQLLTGVLSRLLAVTLLPSSLVAEHAVQGNKTSMCSLERL